MSNQKRTSKDRQYNDQNEKKGKDLTLSRKILSIKQKLEQFELY